MTLVLDSTSAKKLSLLKELALQLGVKVIETHTVLKKPTKKTPNAETQKAIDEAKSGKVYRTKNMTDLMKHLNT